MHTQPLFVLNDWQLIGIILLCCLAFWAMKQR